MNNVLRDPSEARRKSREDSKVMRRDPRIEASLKKRKLATVQLNWSVEPEDDKNEAQLAGAKKLTEHLEAFDLDELLENLLDALWYGPGPAELMVAYDERDRDYKIKGTRSIHGDSVVFDALGNPLLRVGAGYPSADSVAGWESKVRPLTATEREIFVLHTFNPAAPEFFTPEEAAIIFHGSGLREDVWYYWWISNHIHKQWVFFLERYAGGVVVIAHADTVPAREAAEKAIRELKDGGYLLMPIPGDAIDIKGFDIQIKEAPANSGQLFSEYVDGFTGAYIKRIIEGQSLTSEAGPTGLGSGLAQAHQDTFAMFIEYDARRLARTITEQVVRRLQRWNGIMPDVRFQFKFAIDERTKKEAMEAVHIAHGMGVSFKETEVREITGLSKPDEDDDIIGGEHVPISQNGFDGSGALGNNGAPNRISELLGDGNNNGD